ncbi:MAG: LEPR-XLL domain-containing protein, partial [Planctomycetota bacterium]|nr:LEPR-XLL domain-containing protein [Planctomycetota bacterium]
MTHARPPSRLPPLLEPLEPRVLLAGATAQEALHALSLPPAVYVRQGEPRPDEVLSAGMDSAADEVGTQGLTMGPGDEISVDLVAQWGGPASSAAESGGYAYLCYGPNLAVLDVSDLANPTLLGKVALAGASDVAISGNLAYVAAGAGGLEIIDVSNPAAPVRLGGYDTSGNAYDVFV